MFPHAEALCLPSETVCVVFKSTRPLLVSVLVITVEDIPLCDAYCTKIVIIIIVIISTRGF